MPGTPAPPTRSCDRHDAVYSALNGPLLRRENMLPGKGWRLSHAVPGTRAEHQMLLWPVLQQDANRLLPRFLGALSGDWTPCSYWNRWIIICFHNIILVNIFGGKLTQNSNEPTTSESEIPTSLWIYRQTLFYQQVVGGRSTPCPLYPPPPFVYATDISALWFILSD